MQNSAPIKRHQAIVSFSKDHHFGLLLVWKIRQGLKKAVNTIRIADYVLYFFAEDLTKHFKEEEQFLFSLLPVDNVYRKQAEEEHHAIYTLIKNIEENKNDIVSLHQLADMLEQHIRFEERVLFNHLQENISEEILKGIAGRLSNNATEIDNGWEDRFWE